MLHEIHLNYPAKQQLHREDAKKYAQMNSFRIVVC